MSDRIVEDLDPEDIWGLQKIDFNKHSDGQTDRQTDRQTDMAKSTPLSIRTRNIYTL